MHKLAYTVVKTDGVFTLIHPGTGVEENIVFSSPTPLINGVWTRIPSIFRLRLTGTGSVIIDSKNALDSITAGIASYSPSGATNDIQFPYAGDTAVAIRATLTGSATAEVI